MAENKGLVRTLHELNKGDVVEVKGRIRNGLHVVVAIGEVPEHERQIVLSPIYCPECPPEEIDHYRATIDESDLGGSLLLEKMRNKDYNGWKYAAIKRIVV